MPQQDAKIRPYVKGERDNKLVRFHIGKGQMEGLAVANRKATTHPLTIAAWIALSCIMIQYFNWWPQPGLEWWTYLKPLPAFAAWSVPLMFLADWYNRPYFEERTQDILRRPDILDIHEYYFKRSPSSGFWILEYGDRFIGFIAVDASLDSTSEDTVITAATAGKALRGKNDDATSDVATIRHFYVQEEYRSAFVQDDLLEYAIKHAFTSHESVKSIRATDSALALWASKALRSQGFVLDKVVGNVGVLRWPVRSRILTRERWEQLKRERDQK